MRTIIIVLFLQKEYGFQCQDKFEEEELMNTLEQIQRNKDLEEKKRKLTSDSTFKVNN